MEETFRHIIGPDSNAINWWQMCIRGVLIFCIALLLVRVGDRRIFNKNAAFDIVLSIILGSVLSRAITGNAPFVPNYHVHYISGTALVFCLACRTQPGFW